MRSISRLPAQLIGGVGDVFLFAAEAKRLAEVIALHAKARKRRAALLRLAIGEAGEAERRVEAEALRQLGIEIELTALPQSPAEERRRCKGLSRLAAAGKAVGAFIGRANPRIGGRDEGGLGVNVPVRRFRQRSLAGDGS